MNEIMVKDSALAMAFPDVFLLGKAYGRSAGTMNATQQNHLLGQFSLVPAQNRLLLGYLFDSMQRAKVNFGVTGYVKGNSEAVDAICNLLEDEEKQDEIQHAISNPTSKQAVKLANEYLRHLNFSGRDISYGAVEARFLKSKLMESAKRYGPYSGFLTFSFSDLDNPRSIRAAFSSFSNTSFPAVFEDGCPQGNDGKDFMERLRAASQEESSGFIHTSTPNWSDRAEAAMSNPVAFVAESKALIHDVCSILLGIPPEDFYGALEGASKRKTPYF